MQHGGVAGGAAGAAGGGFAHRVDRRVGSPGGLEGDGHALRLLGGSEGEGKIHVVAIPRCFKIKGGHQRGRRVQPRGGGRRLQGGQPCLRLRQALRGPDQSRPRPYQRRRQEQSGRGGQPVGQPPFLKPGRVLRRGGLGGGLLQLEQIPQRQAEQAAQAHQLIQLGQAGVGLPLGHGLAADAQGFPQRLLGKALLLAQGLYALTKGHGSPLLSGYRLPNGT